MNSFPTPCAHRIDKYRFATTTLDSAFNYEPLRWMLEGTNDATAAGGDAYDPYGMVKCTHTQRPTKPHTSQEATRVLHYACGSKFCAAASGFDWCMISSARDVSAGFCNKGLNQNSTGACMCTAHGVPYCSTVSTGESASE